MPGFTPARGNEERRALTKRRESHVFVEMGSSRSWTCFYRASKNTVDGTFLRRLPGDGITDPAGGVTHFVFNLYSQGIFKVYDILKRDMHRVSPCLD